jgi:hypothetical protein
VFSLYLFSQRRLFKGHGIEDASQKEKSELENDQNKFESKRIGLVVELQNVEASEMNGLIGTIHQRHPNDTDMWVVKIKSGPNTNRLPEDVKEKLYADGDHLFGVFKTTNFKVGLTKDCCHSETAPQQELNESGCLREVIVKQFPNELASETRDRPDDVDSNASMSSSQQQAWRVR